MSIIKSLSVGNGDMFYIKHHSDSFSIIDCCIDESNRDDIIAELKRESCSKSINRFISTHPDNDHIKGLQYLNYQMPIQNFYSVKNNTTKEEETDDFKEYCELKDSEKSFYLEKDCKRFWLNKSNETRDGAGISILWPITDNEHYKMALKEAENGNSPNNISPIIQYSCGAKILWLGDLETEFMKTIENDVSLKETDIIFAPHHGRDSGRIPSSWLKKLNPQLIVIGEAPSKHLNYYEGFDTIKQNSSGDLLFECVKNKVNIYVESESYREDFLINEPNEDKYNLFYIGTLKT